MSIPNGWIEATPASWGLKGDDGKEQFEIEFKTEHGSIRWWGGFKTDRATEYTIKQIRKCGWQGDDLSNVALASVPVSILVEEEEYNGTKRQKVKAVGGGGAAPMEASKAQSFAQRMAAKVKTLESKAAPDFVDAQFEDDPTFP